jgi:catechol 2,3-dioxygenase-like lactoylglutathione lyase family enzyme
VFYGSVAGLLAGSALKVAGCYLGKVKFYRDLFHAAFTVLTVFAGVRLLSAQSNDRNPLQLSPHHATISVADMEKETAWFERVLGFHREDEPIPAPQSATIQLRHMTIPGYRIDLFWQKGSVRRRQVSGGMEQGWFHVVFKTPAIDADFKRLMDAGTDVTANRNAQSAITRLVFHDPEGNELEIVPQ